jgi:hypothetical protein
MCPDATFITVITDRARDPAGPRGGWGQRDAFAREQASVSMIRVGNPHHLRAANPDHEKPGQARGRGQCRGRGGASAGPGSGRAGWRSRGQQQRILARAAADITGRQRLSPAPSPQLPRAIRRSRHSTCPGHKPAGTGTRHHRDQTTPSRHLSMIT